MLMHPSKVSYLIYAFFLLGASLAKAQPQGERQYSGFDDFLQIEISVFDSGEYGAVASSTQSTMVLFFDACGDTLWTKEFFKGHSYNRLIRAQNDNEYLYLAAALGTGFSDTAIALIKISKTGQLVLSKIIAAPGKTFRWYQFHIDEANDLYFTGNCTNTNANLAGIILKLNSQGQEIHAYQYGNSFIWGMSIKAKSGGILNTTGNILYKVDANGSLEWQRRYSSGLYQSMIPPISLNDGYLIFGSYTGASDRNLVYKIDLQGDFVWSSEVFLNLNFISATLDPLGNISISFTNFGINGVEWGIQKLSPSGLNLGSWTLPLASGDAIYSKDLKSLNSKRMILGGFVDFSTLNNKSLALRHLPMELADLETCQATAIALQTENSQVSQDSNNPNFSPVQFNLFQYQTQFFNQTSLFINEDNFCQTNHDNFSFSLGVDTSICSTIDFRLKADTSASNFNYWWSTGETTEEISLPESGLYWLEISNDCGSFRFRDSIIISIFPLIEFQLSFSPESAFTGEEVSFLAAGNGSFIWHHNNKIKAGAAVKFIASSAFADGVIVEFIDSNNCASYDTLYPQLLETNLYMPNAFSPNGDGLNDIFGLKKGVVYHYTLDIYDRYGAQIASLNNESWNGRNYLSGSYLYILRYQFAPAADFKTIKSTLNLIR
jgi:gliding motility-associated-like protein